MTRRNQESLIEYQKFVQDLPPLPESFEQSEAREKLVHLNTEINYGNQVNLRAILKDEGSCSVKYNFTDDEHKPYLRTTTENPSILAEDSASYCTMMTLSDKEGNAMICHRSLQDKLDKNSTIYF